MLTFSDFTVRLAQGQLKLTSAVSDNDKNNIADEHLSSILTLTNQGLLDLSTRFKLFTRQIDLVFSAGVYTYPMTAAGAALYLDDSLTEPFQDDFIKILDVVDSDGDSHAIDTGGHIITPSYNTLRFTSAKQIELGTKVRIRYQVKHPTITQEDGDNLIDLPPNLETSLQLFVASLYFSHMNSEEHSKKGDNYMAAYLRHIGEDQRVNNSGTSEVEEDTRFSDKGFV